MKLLLVDGSNLVMRAAFGGQIPPGDAVPVATGLILRAARQVQATHMVIALDSPEPSWRKEALPAYKANRTTDTTPWIRAAFEGWTRAKHWVEAVPGFEADDIIATIARRVPRPHTVIALSSDSDALVLTAYDVQVLKPQNGGTFELLNGSHVCTKYKLTSPGLLTDFKAMTGESGDNVPGVPGIGPVRAQKLLQTYGTLESVIVAGRSERCRDAKVVAAHEAAARLAFRLVSLSCNVPIQPIQPKHCCLNL